MKKILKKSLILNKSTISNLNEAEMDRIKGQATTLYTILDPCTLQCSLACDLEEFVVE